MPNLVNEALARAQHRHAYTAKQSGFGHIPSDWGQIGGVVILDNGKFCASCPKIVPPPQCDTLAEAWDFVEAWRLMNGMNEDGTPA